MRQPLLIPAFDQMTELPSEALLQTQSLLSSYLDSRESRNDERTDVAPIYSGLARFWRVRMMNMTVRRPVRGFSVGMFSMWMYRRPNLFFHVDVVAVPLEDGDGHDVDLGLGGEVGPLTPLRGGGIANQTR